MNPVLARQQATGKSEIAALLGFLGMRQAMIFRSVFGSLLARAPGRLALRYSVGRTEDPRFCPP